VKKFFFLLFCLILPVSLTSCSNGQEAEKGEIVISGKDWTEQWILAHLLAEYLKANTDLKVRVREGLGTEAILTEALKSGDIDMYVEYTGTGYLAILKQPYKPGMDPKTIYERTKQGYEKNFQITWLKPLGFYNNYAMSVRKETAQKLGASKLSDLKGKASSLTMGAPSTFYERKDGYDGMTKTYGFSFGKKISLDEDLMYKAVDNGNVDIITGFSTDPRIKQFDLAVLEDDKKFFPPYDAVPVIRQAVLQANPGLKEKLNALAGKISTNEMMAMNAEVNLKGKRPREVARSFLKKKGLIP
jgi:osmoprotectant transport system substrate-binding protein